MLSRLDENVLDDEDGGVDLGGSSAAAVARREKKKRRRLIQRRRAAERKAATLHAEEEARRERLERKHTAREITAAAKLRSEGKLCAQQLLQSVISAVVDSVEYSQKVCISQPKHPPADFAAPDVSATGGEQRKLHPPLRRRSSSARSFYSMEDIDMQNGNGYGLHGFVTASRSRSHSSEMLLHDGSEPVRTHLYSPEPQNHALIGGLIGWVRVHAGFSSKRRRTAASATHRSNCVRH